jgi:tight adherence protein B
LLRLLAEAGVRQRAEELLQWTLVGSVVGGAVLTLLTSPGIALVVLIAAFTCAYVRLRSRADTRRQLLRAQIPDLLDGLAQALRAGLSFPQAVSRMAADSPAPVASLVAALDVDLNCGRSIAEGFERFGQTAQLRELRMVSAAVSLMHRVGGNAPAMLEQTAGVIRQDLLLNRSLKTQTAQGRMSVRLVGSVPFVLVALMSIVLPDYLRSWLASGLGRAMFAAAIVLLLTGFLWVRKVVDIAV